LGRYIAAETADKDGHAKPISVVLDFVQASNTERVERRILPCLLSLFI